MQENNSQENALKYLRIRNKSGEVIPLAANTVQQRFEQRAGNKNIVLKARQMGLSTWIAGRFLLNTILNEGNTTVLVAHTQEAGETIFRAVQRMWDLIPDNLVEQLPKRKRNNSGLLAFSNDSEFRIVSASEVNAGRGLTIHNLHCSELSRWPGDPRETLAGLKAALVPHGQLVMESTPRGAYGCFYEEWNEAEANGVVRHFFPWWLEPGYTAPAVNINTLTEEEQQLCEKHHLSLEQISFRRSLQKTYRKLHAQEFAEDAVSCFLSTGQCIFDIDTLQQRLKDHNPHATRWNGALEIWYPPQKGRSYIIGVDPAGGGSEGDFSTAQIVDKQTGLQCAELQERIAPRAFAKRIEQLAREYNNATLVIERNNHGHAVIAYLKDTKLNIHEDANQQQGLLTTAATRPEMISELAVLLTDRPELFQSQRLLQECRTFINTKTGRAEAAAGSHDDLVMSMCLAQSVARRK